MMMTESRKLEPVSNEEGEGERKGKESEEEEGKLRKGSVGRGPRSQPWWMIALLLAFDISSVNTGFSPHLQTRSLRLLALLFDEEVAIIEVDDASAKMMERVFGKVDDSVWGSHLGLQTGKN
ncbi:hypothetical protein RHGRI_023404 [Rhododendron griersonianum]|uniref:Uncharacterized protein n=1 Tax=Rhododendron griersonianum TaxID=479676 RepID=A0AAV6J395_9ERIC|nr:hypothetical protein RHGRI_023404 [Rhododendron griersonianum]